MSTSKCGTYAGYVAGCRCTPCRDARYKAAKERNWWRHQNGSCRIPTNTIRDVIAPWLAMGLTRSAIAQAAGISMHALDNTRDQRNRGTLAAVAAITEDDFPANVTVFADLTRTRIYSLMAAGHRLNEIPVAYRGTWRHNDSLRVGVAREVRAYYRAHEAAIGTDAHTMARARNAGHVPPLAWDDPDTLAWPTGARPRVLTRALAQAGGPVVDEVVVTRILAGDVVRANRAEREEVVRRWVQLGRSLNELERLTGWNTGRYYKREEVA